MSTTASGAPDSIPAAPAPRVPPGTASGWIQSRSYDVGLLLLAPLVGVPFLALAPDGASRAGLLACALLGFPHYLSTFTFFFWDENRDYHRERWRAYFVVPTLILLGFGALAYLDQPPRLLPAVLLFWNAYHVARQSCGVVSIYRHRAGVAETSAKRAANAAITLTSLWLCLANLETHPHVFPLLVAVHPRFLAALRVGLGCAALVASVGLVLSLRERARAGRPALAPELLALACGILLFHPYLWVLDSAKATLGMLMGHFLQYLALVWLLHRRRFREVSGTAAQRVLAVISSDPRALAAALLTAAGVMVGTYLFCARLGFKDYFQAGFQILVFTHFYLDSLFWAFKEPRVRARLTPYLAA